MVTQESENTGAKALTGKQQKALNEALEAAIPDRGTLEMFLTFNDELGVSKSDIPDMLPYPQQMFKVIELTIGNGNLQRLVIKASIDNPGNSKLRRFVEDYLQLLLEIDSNPIASDALTSLVTSLRTITDFEIVLAVCNQTLPDLDLDSNHTDLKDNLLSGELGIAAKWLILLKLFLKTWERNVEGQLYIVKFVQNLKQQALNATTKAALIEWLNSLPVDLQPTPTEPEIAIQGSRPPNEALKTLQAHFLLTVAANPIKDKEWWVNGYLITRLGEDEHLTKFRTLTLQLLPDESSAQSSESRAESLCLKVSSSAEALLQIERCLPDWLVQVQSNLGNQCIDLRKDYKLSFLPIYDLTVEFWLPFEHLIAAADTWKVYGKPISRKQRNLLVGKEYQVVVRSYDRFSDLDALNTLNRTWQTLVTLSQDSFATASDPQNIHHLDCWTRWADLQQQMQQGCLGLSIAFPLNIQEYESQREELFSWILENGIPMVLWSRCSDLTDTQKTSLKGLLSPDIIFQIDQFLGKIKQARKAAESDQLALWCDEPKRLSELKQFLEPGRLSA